jgi:hypothetical protein
MIKPFLYGLIGIVSLALAFGWTQAGFWPVGLSLLVMAPLWLVAVKRKIDWASALILVALTVLSVIGTNLGLAFFYALTGVLGGLAAWDLEHFSRRLNAAAAEDDPAALERRHLLQLAFVLLGSAGCAALSLEAEVKFNFNREVALVLVSIGGIGALIHWLRGRED